ncbi:RHS repeat protein, partial [Mucilaginibacter sp. HC2]|uniref:RHS repeat protein n=1 Tax=Mucilaginibacter inviolabilis TaxID=2714892 RepID=UPI00140A6479
MTYYSGIPEINIPLYEIRSGKLTVPLSISYHASGLKFGTLSGVIGMGWSLNGGGEVSRTVVGKEADEYATFPYPIKKANQINAASTADKDFLEQLTAPASLSNLESEYDIFYYNTPTGGGKFILNNTGNNIKTPVTIPFSPIRITSNLPNFTGAALDYFEIVDESGILYRFGKSLMSGAINSETTHSSSKAGGISDNLTGWFLSEMISADKSDTISFKYKSFTQYRTNNTYSYTVLDNLIVTPQPPPISGTCPLPPPSNTDFETQTSNSASHSSSGTLTLSEIDFRNGKVTFSYIPDPAQQDNLRLSVINITNQSGAVIKNYTFQQSNYTSNNSYYKLDGLNQYDSANQQVQKYIFDYNQTSFSGFNNGTTAIDHWGFYNGQTSNLNTLTPRTLYAGPYSAQLTSGNANREANDVYMQAGILTKITYPTGGSSTFFYEGNVAPNYANSVKNVGGLRIKRIENVSNANQVEVKTYKYGVGESGMGQMLIDPYIDDNFTQYSKELVACTYSSSDPIPSYKRSVRTISSDFVDGSGNFESLPVFYNTVTEYSGDENSNTGKTQFFFRPPSNSYYESDGPVTRYIKSFNNWTLGLMTGKSVFRNDNNNYTLIRSENYTYYDKPSVVLSSLKAYRNYNGPASGSYGTTYTFGAAFAEGNNAYTYFDYNITTGVTLLQKKEIKDILNNITSVETYKYGNFHNKPLEIALASSKADSIMTRSKYPTEYVNISSSDPTSLGVKNLLALNVIDPLVEQSVSRKISGQTQENLVGATFNTYKTAQPFLDKIYSIENTTAINDFSPSSVQGGAISSDPRYVAQISMDSYDPRGNLTQQKRINGIPFSYIWSYNRQYPVAEIKNGDYNTIVSLLGGTTAVDNFANSNPTDATLKTFLAPLRTNSAMGTAQVTTYTYSPLVGITSITDTKGETTTYEYDSFQRLMNVKDKDGNIVKHMDYH